MYSLFAFTMIPSFVSNEPDTVSKLGQITTYGRTFTQEIGEYEDRRFPDVQLVTLDSFKDKDRVEVSIDYYSVLLRISQWLYDKSVAGSIPNNPVQLKQQLNSEFESVAVIKDVGLIKQFRHYSLPDRIEVEVLDTGEDNSCQIWFSNESLEVEYPEHTFKNLLPVDPIDNLHGDRDLAFTEMKKINEENHNKRLNTLIGKQRETGFITMMINWTDKNNPDITFPVPFSSAYYGPTGNNIDLIKEQWREEIDKQSNADEDTKTATWPDLYIPTEFYIVPIWDRFSLPNQADNTGTYSPSVPYTDIMKYATKYFKGYKAEHIGAATCVSSAAWESIAFIACGNEKNYRVPYMFTEMWPKYVAIDPLSPDFARVPPKTREFISALHTLFEAAQTATPKSLIPSGMTRVERDGVFYLTLSIDNVVYLCPIKYDFKME